MYLNGSVFLSNHPEWWKRKYNGVSVDDDSIGYTGTCVAGGDRCGLPLNRPRSAVVKRDGTNITDRDGIKNKLIDQLLGSEVSEWQAETVVGNKPGSTQQTRRK